MSARPPKLAFYGVLEKPGGVGVAEAMRRADAALEAHRAQASAAMREALDALDAQAQARALEPDAIYERASFVLDIAGLFAPPLCRAAHSLCELVTRMKAAGRWDWPSVDVHVAAMRLLAKKSCDKDPAVQTVLSGLGAVVGRHPDPSPP